MRKLAVLALAVVGLASASTASASAAAPERESFSFTFTQTQMCPGITIEGVVTGTEIFLQETPELVVRHENAVTTLAANGKTLTDNDAFNVVVDLANGVFTYRGVVFNIQAPGVGRLLMDVGILIFDAGGNVFFQGGPHPAFYGDVAALCEYLADP
jgi:hypothetical protein